MDRKLYDILGVTPTADADAIKKAYRKLARETHPDKNPGDKKAEERFKQVNAAFEVLGDAEKRKLYDEFGDVVMRPGFDADRARAWKAGGGGAGAPGPGFQGGFGFGEDVDFSDLLSQFINRGGFGGFGRGFGGGGAGFNPGFGSRPAAARHVRASLGLGFREAARGGSHTLHTGDGRAMNVRIPPGVRDGETIRIPGQGHPATGGGKAGDLLLTLQVAEDPHFRREGEDLHVVVPVTVGEAVRGGKIPVPTLDGEVTFTLPARSQTGRRLRLSGKGIARRNQAPGDLYVEVRVVVPDSAPPEVLAALDAAYGADVRAALRADPTPA
jgi:curved DNA-binding protein